MSEVAEEQEDLAVGDDTVSQFLTFLLGGRTFAINILDIREIIGHGNITAVPMMPEFIAGVINLRGSVVPVIDLAVRFSGESMEITKRTSIVIAEIIDEDIKLEVGLIVDSVSEVLNIANRDIEPPPAFGSQIRTDFISGMGKVGDELLVLLDVRKVLSIEELSMVTDLNETADS